MFCVYCAFPLEEGDLYCGKCGRKTVEAIEAGLSRPLQRPTDDKKVAGVCAGVARYLDVDTTVVRLLWVGASIVPFVPGLIAYPICWALMPRDEQKLAAHAKGRVTLKSKLLAFRQRA